MTKEPATRPPEPRGLAAIVSATIAGVLVLAVLSQLADTFAAGTASHSDASLQDPG